MIGGMEEGRMGGRDDWRNVRREEGVREECKKGGRGEGGM